VELEQEGLLKILPQHQRLIQTLLRPDKIILFQEVVQRQTVKGIWVGLIDLQCFEPLDLSLF
jgi:hypothetical protein